MTFSADSSFRDLPPIWRDPGPDAIVVNGAPVPFHAGMQLSELASIDRHSVVVWRCADGRLGRLRPRGDVALRAHDWVSSPDPASIF
jgi:hypothetical protein